MGTWCCCQSVLSVCFTLFLLQHASAAAEQQRPVICPVQYSKHSLEDIRSRAKVPYLLGGIYDESRNCSNCKRGGLWADFCGFKSLGKSRYYDMQLCSSSTVEAVVNSALQMDNAVDLLTLTPCDLWPYLRGRTTWIIGDSMSKDLYKALRCFLVEFQDLNTFHATDNFTAMHFLQAIPGKGEPRCVHMLDNTRLCQIHAIEGDLFVASDKRTDRTAVGGVIPLIQQHLAFKDDIFIVHFGLWHGETRQEAYKKYLHQLGKYYQSIKDTFPHMFFMETPKQHFDSEDGDFKVPWIRTRKGPWTCQKIQGVSLNPDGSLTAAKGNKVAEYVARGSWRNQHAREILGKYQLPLLPIYNVTVPAWEFHRQNLDGQECSHFCHPSLPQFWLWHVLATFKQQQLPVVDDPWKQIPKSGCAIIRDWEETKFGAPKPKSVIEKEEERERHKGFWEWLQGKGGVWKQLAVKDGVLVRPAGSSDSDSVKSDVSSWEVVQKLLDLRLLQRPQSQQQQDKGADAEAQGQGGKQQAQPSQQQPRVQQEKRRSQEEKGSRPLQQQQQQRQRQASGNKAERARAQELGDRLVARHRRKKQPHAQQQEEQQHGGADHHNIVVKRQAGD